MSVAETADGTDLRFMLKGGAIVQIRSNADLGPDELDRLLKLVATQKDVLRKAETASVEPEQGHESL
jgi:hypothetical protein